MRILHTSDWHLGCTLDGRPREEEQRALLDSLCRCAEALQADLVLVAGDIYDTYHPPVWAQELFYSTLERLGASGALTVVIAGNHDSPDCLCAPQVLALRHGAYLLGRPQDMPPLEGPGLVASGEGWLRLRPERAGCDAVLSLLPYASEGRLCRLLSEEQEGAAHAAAYAAAAQQLLARGSAQFSSETVNVAMAHLFAAGGVTAGDERAIEGVGGSALVPLSAFPQAQYIALGHLHRPQQLAQNAYYSGSLLASSFDEPDGIVHQAFLVDVVPGEEPVVHSCPLSGGCPLLKKQFQSAEEALSYAASDGDRDAWLAFSVSGERPLTHSQIAELRKLRPRLTDILWQSSAQAQQAEPQRWRDRSPAELFDAFYQAKRGAPPSEELTRCFAELLEGGEE